ncbi:alpha/beta hydrolase [Algoriphagus boritolerans]
MGDQDVMFLEPVKNLVKEHKNSILKVLESCGHVVNVEKPDQFNHLSVAFIKNQQ